MQTQREIKGTKLFVKSTGRIDTVTAIDWGTKINDDLDDLEDIFELILDFSNVSYVSSMGLRVILELQRRMKIQGAMKITNVQKNVMDIFEMTGFDNILAIE